MAFFPYLQPEKIPVLKEGFNEEWELHGAECPDGGFIPHPCVS